VSRFTVPFSGGIYLGKMLGIIFIVVKLFSSLDCLSEGGREGPAQVVEGEASSSPEDDIYTPLDI
jgi:hypothetical protein